MTSQPNSYASVSGHRVTRLRVTVANVGPWVAEADFAEAPDLSGAATVRVGDLEMVGTVVESQTGTFGLQRKARIVGGGGGWSRALGAKHYHNDAGVRAKLVAEDAAREVGETLSTFVPRAERIGVDYVRQTGQAARVLEDVVGGVPWWVGYDGKTYVGARPETSVDPSKYETLAYDPRERIATLAMDDLRSVGIGSVLTKYLDAPQTVRELEMVVTSEEVRVLAWCGGSESGPGQLAGLLQSIARRATDWKLFGAYRYRVVRMSGQRVELQAVRKDAGLPDVLPVSMWPGIAGVHAQLAPSAEVLVSFVEGDRTMPVVTHFAGADGVGFVPVSLTLGGTSGPPAARQGDVVECQLPPATFSGTIGGSPASGLITFTPAKALGTIVGGSGKVRVA